MWYESETTGGTDPPGLHCERPRLHFKPLNPLNFDFNADLDQAFHSNADPDPSSQNNSDPCGSGSATLILTHRRGRGGRSVICFLQIVILSRTAVRVHRMCGGTGRHLWPPHRGDCSGRLDTGTDRYILCQWYRIVMFLYFAKTSREFAVAKS